MRFQLASGPSAKGERSGQNDSPAEEQSRMWSEDPGQPDHRPAQTFADLFRILVNFATGRAELPCIRQADDKSPYCVRPRGLATKSMISNRATTNSVQDD